VQQAGGKVSDFKGGNNYLFGGEICAGNYSIQPSMVNLIQQKWYPDK
jgi:myo-inositol-1(or 4)-monophosphatase